MNRHSTISVILTEGVITVLNWQPEVLLLHSFKTQPKHIPPKPEAFPVH